MFIFVRLSAKADTDGGIVWIAFPWRRRTEWMINESERERERERERISRTPTKSYGDFGLK